MFDSKLGKVAEGVSGTIEYHTIAYTRHDPIYIASDAEFIAQAALEGWPGDGSESNPYRIEGYNITHTGFIIQIENVTMFFEIRNCYLASNSSGVHIESSSDCEVYSNDFDNASIEICDSGNCEIYSNEFYNGSEIRINCCFQVSVSDVRVIAPSDQGILVSNSSHCNISNSILYSSPIAGIVAMDSLSCSFTSNTISHCQNGILICNDTSSSLFTNNYIFNQSEYGIKVESGSDNWIYANIVASEGTGFFLDDGVQNHWDDGFFLGNFLPGITEGIFPIDGSAGSEDQFARPVDPEPVEEPVICSDPILVKLGDFDGILACVVWLREETRLYRFEIIRNRFYINGAFDRDIEWSGPCTIVIDVEGLAPGIYEFSLFQDLWVPPFDEGEIHLFDFTTYLPGFYSPIDNDADDMFDEWEIEHGLDPLSNDSEDDPDSDDLSNLHEFMWNTDPQNPDTDSDLMPDGWEAHYDLRPWVDDSGLDKDSDGLCNLDEYLHGTDPEDSDSDSDSITDGWEVTFGQNPLDPSDALIDSDADTLTNLQEFLLGTNPTSPDSDFDSYPDAWEVRYGFDPLTPPDTMYEEIAYFAPFIITGYLTLSAISVVTIVMNRMGKMLLKEQSQLDEEEEIKRQLQALMS